MKKLLIVGGMLVLPVNLLGQSIDQGCMFGCPDFFNGYTSSCKLVCNDCSGETYSDAVNGVITVQTQKLITLCPSVSGAMADCRCEKTTTFKCAAGYYGTPSLLDKNCTQCPEATDIYTNSTRTVRARGTSNVGATSRDKCYLPAGTYYDATGQFVIDSDQTCYY